MDRERELELVEGLRRRDAAAFDGVFLAFHPRVFNFLARLARNRDVAEDLAEETWLRVVVSAPRLRPDTRLAPWLFTVARNLYVSYCRSRALETDAGIGLWPVPATSPSPFETTSASELQTRVEAAMATLPRTLREALLLVAVEGLTPAEAAQVCDVRPEAMRQRLSRARAMLAERLETRTALRIGVPKEVLL